MGRVARGKTKFQSRWIQEFPWASSCSTDAYRARCTLCSTDFRVDSMGRQSLVSHSKGIEHNRILKATSATPSITSYASVLTTKPSDAIITPSPTASTTSSGLPVIKYSTENPDVTAVGSPGSGAQGNYSSQNRNMKTFVKTESVSKAEALWCLQTVMCHSSLRSAASSASLFQVMFPDSDIARGMQLKKSKVSYVIVYGIAPYFKQQLVQEIQPCTAFVVGFDESLNKISQKQQMDISLRFWNKQTNKVSSRYFNSVFLERTTANDLLNGLKNGLDGLNLDCILQLSMDGPNVNLKLQKDLAKELRSGLDDPKLLDMGSCGIHVLHNSFKAGINGTGWSIVEFLRSLYYLFKDVPARRAHFVEISGQTKFPLKFCSVRWLENSNVAARVISIFANLCKYVKAVKGTQKEPNCKSFQIVAAAVDDKLLLAKLTFFQSLATEVEPFLREFQTDNPMAPFLFDAIYLLLQNAMRRFIKSEIIEANQLMKIDMMNKENLLRFEDVDIGYATRQAVKKCSGVSLKDVLIFRKECRTCLQLFVAKIMVRSPLRFPLTEAIKCLNPATIASGNVGRHITSALDILTESNLLPGINTADKVAREYREFGEQDVVKEEMKSYCRSDTRLDSFWMMLLGETTKWENLKNFVRLILILSHGNSHLERGFSINKECLVENQTEISLVAQRCVFDSVSVAGGVDKVEVGKSMIYSIRHSYSRYQQALESRKKSEEAEKTVKEQKKRAAREVKELQEKKKKLMMDTQNEIAKLEEQIKHLKE